MGQSIPARIMVIEDNAADVFLLRHALNQHGEDFVLEILRDGEEAIEFVHLQRGEQSRDAHPCVIVLDLHLPKHNGTAVLSAIRDEPSLDHVHVVALTTLASPRDEEQVRQLGVRLYCDKPVNVDAWIDLAAQILEICREHNTVATA